MAGNSRSGRNRKPASQKILEGNPGKRSLNESEPKATGYPEKPEGLNDWGEWAWGHLVPKLVAMGVAKEIDSIELGEACRMFGYYRQACNLADRDPVDKDNRIAVTSYWAAFDKIAARFGLTPSDRARLQVTTPTGTEEEKALQLLYFGE